MSFKSDLTFGNNYETILINNITHEKCIRPEGYFKEYDFELFNNNNSVKYEVKADRLGYKTNNIAIEYECNNKSSGITTTTADNIAYFVVDKKDITQFVLFIIPTKYIRQKIKEKYYRGDIRGGDNYLSRMYLFNVNLFLDYYRQDLSTSTIDKVFSKPVIRESSYDDDE